MADDEFGKTVTRLRGITLTRVKHLRAHSGLLDQAFEELTEVAEKELDIIHDKIEELDLRRGIYGLK